MKACYTDMHKTYLKILSFAHKHIMNAIVVGAYWGDEGKGKIVDLLASGSDWVVRYNGGDNAGHTIVVGDKKVVLHMLPSGILQGKNVAIGPDVFFNPGSFLKDLNIVKESGFDIKGKIVIDERAHVVMPYHVVLDGKKEETDYGENIGTTKRGIGPSAKDRAERTTDITVSDLVSDDFDAKVRKVVESKKEELLSKGVISKERDIDGYCDRVKEVYSNYAERIKEFVGETTYLLNDEYKNGSSLLLEGAQGGLLDVVHGTRPFVTSSNTTAGGAASNLGLDVRKFTVIGIVKAYPTRVGEGPFLTELGSYEDAKNEKQNQALSVSEKGRVAEGDEAILGRWIRMDGKEYGATTGRPRRVGHPDFVALKYSAIINNIDEWVITKLDVLSGKSFKAAVGYEKNGNIVSKFPFRLEGWKPVYGGKVYFWGAMSEKDKENAVREGYEALPKGMREYIRDLVVNTGIPVSMVSIGPERKMTVINGVLDGTLEYLGK
jgi:adenylosuccinate synthase